MMKYHETEWKLLSDLIEQRFGITFNGVRQEILAARLASRLDELHLHSYAEYYRYLLYHAQRDIEMVELSRRITNNETFFFREAHQFELLTHHLAPEFLTKQPGRSLRILSAACSSGEEAYSIVISLQQAGLALRGLSWQIDACDIHPDRLAQARRAVYSEHSLRACDAATRDRYFLKEDDGYHLKENYRQGVRFFQANLVDKATCFSPEPYEIIFCRNVLIYFSEEAFHTTISLLGRSLIPAGYLLLGHSESLIAKRPDFTPLCHNGCVYYQKKAGDS